MHQKQMIHGIEMPKQTELLSQNVNSNKKVETVLKKAYIILIVNQLGLHKCAIWRWISILEEKFITIKCLECYIKPEATILTHSVCGCKPPTKNSQILN